ncbi:hypothetical protein D3C84_1204150 [compost metagenome]
MFGTTPNLVCTELNKSFVFPVTSSGFNALNRVILFNFYVVIYLLSFDITKVRPLQILEHGELTLCDGQFSLGVLE